MSTEQKNETDMDNDVRPEDSISNVSSKVTKSKTKQSSEVNSSSSVRTSSSLQRAMVKEIELAAEAEMVKRRNEIRCKKHELMIKLNEEADNQEIEDTAQRMQQEMRKVEQRAARLRIERELQFEDEKLEDMEAEMKVMTKYQTAQSTTKVLRGY